MIRVGESPGKGRGVFASRPILAAETIEEAPVIVVPAPEVPRIDETKLGDYYFDWGESQKDAGFMLGICSLCNHSYSPNARFYRKYESGAVLFVALRDIAAGEEITVNYNEDPGDHSPLWFDAIP